MNGIYQSIKMIKRYSTRKIDGRNPYARDISLIISRHRGVATEASVLKLEGTASLLVFIIGNHVVATLRYFKKGIAVYVNLVHVLQEHRGKGYSVKLFQLLFHFVKSNIELEV